MPHSFEPLSGPHPKVLILGSMPGAESLKQQMYYAHKSNRFFKILFQFFGCEYSSDSEVRRQLIINNGIALCDVFKYCERENSSLDSRISAEIPGDIGGLLKTYPTIESVLLNGRKAEEGFNKWFSYLTIKSYALPSTSPANASFSFEKLYGIWSKKLSEALGF